MNFVSYVMPDEIFNKGFSYAFTTMIGVDLDMIDMNFFCSLWDGVRDYPQNGIRFGIVCRQLIIVLAVCSI